MIEHTQDRIRDIKDRISPNMLLMRVPDGEEKQFGTEAYLKR